MSYTPPHLLISVKECLERGCGKIEIPGGGSAIITDARISKPTSPLLGNVLGSLKAIADFNQYLQININFQFVGNI